MKSKKLIVLTLLITTITSITACTLTNSNSTEEKNNEKITRIQKKIPRNYKKVISENDIFKIKQPITDLSFTKSGITNAKNTSNVVAQISGEVTKIKVKIGDKVKKGEILIELGNSISTDLNDIQYESAIYGLNTAKEAGKISRETSTLNIDSTEAGIKTAYEVYLANIESKKNAENLFNEQLKNSEKSLKDAKDYYKEIKDNYYNTKDKLDEAQVAELKTAKEAAQKAIEQLESSITQMEIGYETQKNLLDLAINSSFAQYQSGIKQLDIAKNGIEQQNLLTDSQISQAKSAVEISKLSQNYSKIKSPINGTITAINIEEGNMATPGQPIISIQTNEGIIIKTSLNEKEAKLIKKNSPVQIENGDEISEGIISTINPNLNTLSKKIDVEIESFETKTLSIGGITNIRFTVNNENNNFIPINGIYLENNKQYVKSYNSKNEIVYIEVETGEIIGEYIEITQGLKKVENIITATTAFLSRGDIIKIETS